MSFLLVIRKNRLTSVGAKDWNLKTDPCPIDVEKLSTLLCPYKTQNISTKSFHQFHLYMSSTGSFHGDHALFPANSPQIDISPWLRIKIQNHILKIDSDQMGMYPLWLYETSDVYYFTSELKALGSIKGFTYKFKDDSDILGIKKREKSFCFLKDVLNLSIHYVEIDLQSMQKVCTLKPALIFQEKWSLNPEIAKKQLRSSLLESAAEIEKTANDSTWGSFLSGGIDSSVATVLLQEKRKNLKSYTLGTKLGNEYAEAREVASELGIESHELFVSQDEALDLFNEVIWQNEVFDGLTSEILAQMKALIQFCSTKSSNIITGYGSDLLFGGMLRHKEYMEAVGITNEQELIERTYWSGEFRPFYSLSSGVELYHLYWFPLLIQTSMRIPSDLHFQAGVEKVLLRELAVESRWLKREHSFRPKIGMTNGTHFFRLLSNALNIHNTYDYPTKTAYAWEFLKNKLNAATKEK